MKKTVLLSVGVNDIKHFCLSFALLTTTVGYCVGPAIIQSYLASILAMTDTV
jgi:hypothetical protein